MTQPGNWEWDNRQAISGDRQLRQQARFDDKLATAHRLREQLWVAFVGYTVTPPLVDGTILDVDNMTGPPQAGCFICETPWSPWLEKRRCTGNPVQRGH